MAIYDSARRRRSVRKGRERGCWLYVPAEELDNVGWPRDAEPPLYRVWVPKGRRTLLVQFYAEP